MKPASNRIKQENQFGDLAFRHGVKGAAQGVYHHILHTANHLRWPETFIMTVSEIVAKGVSQSTVLRAFDELKQTGFIDHRPIGKGRATRHEIFIVNLENLSDCSLGEPTNFFDQINDVSSVRVSSVNDVNMTRIRRDYDVINCEESRQINVCATSNEIKLNGESNEMSAAEMSRKTTQNEPSTKETAATMLDLFAAVESPFVASGQTVPDVAFTLERAADHRAVISETVKEDVAATAATDNSTSATAAAIIKTPEASTHNPTDTQAAIDRESKGAASATAAAIIKTPEASTHNPTDTQADADRETVKEDVTAATIDDDDDDPFEFIPSTPINDEPPTQQATSVNDEPIDLPMPKKSRQETEIDKLRRQRTEERNRAVQRAQELMYNRPRAGTGAWGPAAARKKKANQAANQTALPAESESQTALFKPASLQEPRGALTQQSDVQAADHDAVKDKSTSDVMANASYELPERWEKGLSDLRISSTFAMALAAYVNRVEYVPSKDNGDITLVRIMYEKYGGANLLRALAHCRKSRGQTMRYVSTVIERWDAHGALSTQYKH